MQDGIWQTETKSKEVLTDTTNSKDYITKMRKRDDELSNGWGQFVTPLGIATKGGKMTKLIRKEDLEKWIVKGMDLEGKISTIPLEEIEEKLKKKEYLLSEMEGKGLNHNLQIMSDVTYNQALSDLVKAIKEWGK